MDNRYVLHRSSNYTETEYDSPYTRPCLVNWLSLVIQELGRSTRVLHTAVEIMDLMSVKNCVLSNNYQLLAAGVVGFTIHIISSNDPVKYEQLSEFTGHQYTSSEVGYAYITYNYGVFSYFEKKYRFSKWRIL